MKQTLTKRAFLHSYRVLIRNTLSPQWVRATFSLIWSSVICRTTNEQNASYVLLIHIVLL
jgi:hypothetical protein